MKLLSEWMEKTRDERTAHADLSTPCECGGSSGKGLEVLLRHFGLTNDLECRSSTGLTLHVCPNDSTHGWCLNPLHLYFGTRADNTSDLPEGLVQEAAIKGGYTALAMGVGIHGLTPERRTEISKKAGSISKKLGVGIHGRTPEAMAEQGRKNGMNGDREGKSKSAKNLCAKRFVSLEDGFIGNPGVVARHNKRLGGDRAARLQLDAREYLYLLPLTGEERLATIERIRQPDALPSTSQHQSCSS